MTNCNCRTRVDCTLLAITASIIIGITTAILSYIATITVTTIFLWVAFGVALGFLALLLLTSITFGGTRKACLCPAISLVLIGVLLSVLSSVVLLVTTLAATSVIRAIVVGVVFGGLALTITSVACYVKCVANCTCAE